MSLVFRLIDKEGYIAENSLVNGSYYSKYFDNDVVCLDQIDSSGYGKIGIYSVIEPDEFQFFEEVSSLVEQCVHTHKGKWKFNYCDGHMYWDKWKGWNLTHGKAVYYTDFERAAVRLGYVKTKEECYTKSAEETTTVHHLFSKEDLHTLVKDPREEFCKKMLKEVQESHVDFRNDTTWDVEELAGWCWDELKGGEGAGN